MRRAARLIEQMERAGMVSGADLMTVLFDVQPVFAGRVRGHRA